MKTEGRWRLWNRIKRLKQQSFYLQNRYCIRREPESVKSVKVCLIWSMSLLAMRQSWFWYHTGFLMHDFPEYSGLLSWFTTKKHITVCSKLNSAFIPTAERGRIKMQDYACTWKSQPWIRRNLATLCKQEGRSVQFPLHLQRIHL